MLIDAYQSLIGLSVERPNVELQGNQSEEETIKYGKEHKELEAANAINRPTAKELTFAKQHVLWLLQQAKAHRSSRYATGSVQNQGYDHEFETSK